MAYNAWQIVNMQAVVNKAGGLSSEQSGTFIVFQKIRVLGIFWSKFLLKNAFLNYCKNLKDNPGPSALHLPPYYTTGSTRIAVRRPTRFQTMHQVTATHSLRTIGSVPIKGVARGWAQGSWPPPQSKCCFRLYS